MARCAADSMALWRLLRCHPFAHGGYDPVVKQQGKAPLLANDARNGAPGDLRRRLEAPDAARFEETVNFARHSKSTTRARQRKAADAGFRADVRRDAGLPAAAQEIFSAAAGPAAAAKPAGAAATRDSATGGQQLRRAAATAANAVTKQASSETETVIENDLYRITFTNRGAQVKSWILKKFDNEAQNGPLDLVNADAAAKYRLSALPVDL